MNTPQIYKIKGMHCASCASIIERTLKKIEGVENISVNNGTENAKISFDENKTNPDQFNKKLEPLGYSLVANHDMYSGNMTAKEMNMSEDEHKTHLGINQSKKEKLAEISDMKSKVISAIPLAIISSVILGWDILAEYKIVSEMSLTIKEFFHHLLPLMATYVLFVVGKPYLLGFYRFLRYGKANMDTLIGIGTLVAYLYSFAVTAFEEPLKQFINVDATYYDVTIYRHIIISCVNIYELFQWFFKSSYGKTVQICHQCTYAYKSIHIGFAIAQKTIKTKKIRFTNHE